MTCLLWLARPAWAGDVRLAVAEFDNAADTHTYDALGKGLQAMLTTDLAQVNGFVLVEREQLDAVTAELSLQQSHLVDPATAAKVGKMLGASDVVLGTFTVLGDHMRLDARVVQVATGQVTTTAEADGDKAAFFELEKSLVKRLIAGLGATPGPKERAAIDRIQTADFGAFSKFSQGIALYDAKRYDEAVATLQQALSADSDFPLAKRTLQDYQALIAQLHAKARALQITQGEQAFVAGQARAKADAAVVADLQARTAKGSPWEDHVAADYVLTVGLDEAFASSGGFWDLKRTEDHFALQRAADAAFADLYATVLPRWPAFSPFYAGSIGTWYDQEHPKPDTFVDLRGYLVRGDHPEMAGCHGLDQIDGVAGDLLHLDQSERAKALDTLSTQAKGCLSEDKWHEVRERLAHLYTSMLALDRSTSVLQDLADQSDDPRYVEYVTKMIDANRALARLLQEHPAPHVREALRLHLERHVFDRFGQHEADDLSAGKGQGLWDLSDERVLTSFVHTRWVWWDGVLAFVLPSDLRDLVSGPRTDAWRTSAVRYYGNTIADELNPDPHPEPVWIVLGSGPRKDFALSVALDDRPADDWWPRQQMVPWEGPVTRQVSKGRPLVGVFFGAHDLQTDPVCDPDGVGMTPVPMHGFAVLLAGGRVRLARVREVDPDLSEKRCGFSTHYIDRWKADDLATAPVPDRSHHRLAVQVKGTAVTVKVDGTTSRFTLPAPADGFVGLVVDGPGYLQLAEPTLQ